MQRKRGELDPIGDALSGIDGLVTAPGETRTPHFTSLHMVRKDD